MLQYPSEHITVKYFSMLHCEHKKVTMIAIQVYHLPLSSAFNYILCSKCNVIFLSLMCSIPDFMSVRSYDLIFFHWSFTSQGLGWYKMFLVDKKEIKL